MKFLGVLIEWEDMFPYTGILKDSRSTQAYTLSETEEILAYANNLQLTTIPLVQTFGHLEWILKSDKFMKYRENEKFPQVYC